MDRIITKRQKNGKVVGYIREIENYPPESCRYNGKYYELYKNGNLITTNANYNVLHEMLYDDKIYKWEVYYRVGNTYKYKIVIANNSFDAIKKSRLRNITELIKCEEV